MRTPVTLTERARGYGLWPGDLLARLPGAHVEHVTHRYDEARLVVSLALPGDASPLDGTPLQVLLTFDDARLRTLRSGWRARLGRSRTSAVPEVVELVRGRLGGYRLLHTTGRLAVRASGLVVDVVPVAVPDSIRAAALAS
ncbi:hypothetical protein [Mumia quercus]|uniref:hypothetical protein n=1 Tax=Mumia quercus TaxID=2976125 RepID=UPI0021D03F8F|nr:hypothetical protein [Mumia quercus]